MPALLARHLIWIAAPLALAAPPRAEPGPPALTLPLACQPGHDCFVQNYPDHGDGTQGRDWRCGGQTYPGHDGTDIRLTGMADQRRGVAVLAAAAGTVRALRDGVPDHLIVHATDRAGLAGRECGNGVVIDHPGGWQTQYCHLARGSVAVARGQVVRAGTRLGLVGASGETEFPHLHFSVRQAGRKLDPFAPVAAPRTCGVGGGRPLWQPAVAQALAYREGVVLAAGFATAAPDLAAIEEGGIARPGADPVTLLIYGMAIGLAPGDRLVARLVAPYGTIFNDSTFLAQTATARAMAHTGARRPPAGWAPGAYRGTITVMRGGTVLAVRTQAITLAGGPSAPAAAPGAVPRQP